MYQKDEQATNTCNEEFNKSNNNVEEDNKDEKEKKGFKFLVALPARQKCILLSATTALFLASIAFSLLGTFFASEAAKKDMEMGTVGLVFGIFQGVIFIRSPVFGTYLGNIGPRLVLFAGVFVGGACNILFGCLHYCPGGTPFIVLSILIRLVEAIGFSGFITATYAFVASEFDKNVGISFSIVQTGAGLGYIIGPSLGGALYELGGFGLPFYLTGCAVFFNGLAMLKYLPAVTKPSDKRKGSILSLLYNPLVLLSVSCEFSRSFGVAAFDSTFAKRLLPLEIPIGLSGLFFTFSAIMYAIFAPLFGFISEYKNIKSPLIVMGLALIGIAFFLLGPSNLLPFIPFNLAVILIALVGLGTGFSCAFAAILNYMVLGAIEMGFENNFDTYALVSGLFTSIQTLGGFVGPLTVGPLIEKFDFPISYTCVGMFNILLGIIALLFFIYRNSKKNYKNKSEEMDPKDKSEKSCIVVNGNTGSEDKDKRLKYGIGSE